MTARILILGGTGEARQLASQLVDQGYRVVSSLAGRTRAPLLPQGDVRIGGFGGSEGLANYLREGGFTHLIDATHPFAAQISANAAAASAQTGVPLMRVERPAWREPDGAEWISVASIAEAARAVPYGANVLLTIGRQEVGAFHERFDCRIVARVIDPPQGAPADWLVLEARGPFSLSGEKELMKAHAITHLVSKNSGGEQASAKLEAAAALGVQVVMVERPALPEVATADSIEEVLGWLGKAGR